jgi:Holliday junction resolvasome RuvABC endonuclease subunit
MKIIGLDISKQSTGVAIGDASSAPRNFRSSFKGGSIGALGHNFRTWFRELLIIEKPDFVCIEAAFVGKTDDAYTATLMLGMNFTAQSVAAGRGIPCETVAVQTWRKAFLGQGRPENPKRAAIKQCSLLGWNVEGNHDRAEACGVFAWGHIYHGDRKAIMHQLSHGSVRRMAS